MTDFRHLRKLREQMEGTFRFYRLPFQLMFVLVLLILKTQPQDLAITAEQRKEHALRNLHRALYIWTRGKGNRLCDVQYFD